MTFKVKTVLLCFMASLAIILPSRAGDRTELALKTNLLYDLTTTPNLGLEIGAGPRSTINLVYGLNPWSFHGTNGKHQAKHWVLMPEYRWWFCTKFDGHFLGVHAMGGQFNASRLHIFLPGGFFGGENLIKGVRDHRYEGWFAGGGISYGYQWILSRHWNFEAEIGIGYNYIKYKKFDCNTCSRKTGEGHTNYAGVTKAALSLVYLF